MVYPLTFAAIMPNLSLPVVTSLRRFLPREFNEHFQVYNIKHIRIPLYVVWVGSTWESMIRTIKSRLYITIGRSRINYFDLLTVISDIQNAINSRSLTYRCSSDSNLEIIMPNCFLVLT